MTTGLAISTACLDWEDRLRRGEVPINAELMEYAGTDAGRFARGWLGRLRLPDVPGTPRLRDSGAEWFTTIAAIVAGSLDEDTGERAIKHVFLMVPKKNSKTTFAALLMLVLMIQSRTPRAVFNFFAPTTDVAALAFGQAAGAVALDDKLSLALDVKTHTKRIVNRQTGAVLRVVPFSARAATGVRGSSMVDELHVCSTETNADRTHGQIAGALVGDPAAVIINVTTQSERPPAGIMRTMLERARAVRDGTVDDPSFLPVLYEPPAGCDPHAESTWALVTPNLGRSITIPRLRTAYEAAKQAGDGELRRWLTQHVDMEADSVTGEAWDLASAWASMADPTTGLMDALSVADLVVVGIDTGGAYDSTGAAVLVRSSIDGSWWATAKGWASHEAMEKRAGVDQWLQDLVNSGDMSVGPVGADVVGIGAWVREIAATGVEVLLAVDPYGPVGELQAELADTIPEELLIGAPQGWKLSPAIDTLERWVLSGTLKHDGSRYLASCVNNAAIVERGAARGIVKRDQQSKIDGLSALLSAIYVSLHGAKETKAEGVSPWTDPLAAWEVANGDVPLGDTPETPRGAGYVRIA